MANQLEAFTKFLLGQFKYLVACLLSTVISLDIT